jgi:hypothetical protein
MAGDPIVRPSFFEGQILAAADLAGELDYARGQLARHERVVHRWGIADGLTLVGADQQTPLGDKYVTVTVGAGLAIDGTGRELVVPDAEPLSEQLFQQLNVAAGQTSAWYPVLLVGHDEAGSPGGSASFRCATPQPTRVVEGYELTFGRPGEEFDLDQQVAPTVSAGPGGGPDDLTPWRVLLGFVQWSAPLGKFTAVADAANGVGRRYVGLRADEVEAQGGKLELRSRPASVGDAPLVVIDAASGGGGELAFGRQDGRGGVKKVFTVNAKGDVSAAGKIAGLAMAGVYVESGIATEGMILPLPSAVTEEAVTAGDVVLHIQVTPHLPGPPAPSGNVIPVQLQCEVDGDRRVLSSMRWQNPAGLPPPISSAPCDYTVIAVVPAKETP